MAKQLIEHFIYLILAIPLSITAKIPYGNQLFKNRNWWLIRRRNKQ